MVIYYQSVRCNGQSSTIKLRGGEQEESLRYMSWMQVFKRTSLYL